LDWTNVKLNIENGLRFNINPLFFFCVKKGDCIRLLFLFCLLVLMMMEILAYVCACALERERWKNWKSDQDSRLLGQLSWPPHLTNDFSGHFFRTRMEQLSPCSLPSPPPSDFICLALSIFLFSIPVCFYFDWCVCAYFDDGTLFPPALWFSVMHGTNIPGQWNLDIGDYLSIAIFVNQNPLETPLIECYSKKILYNNVYFCFNNVSYCIYIFWGKNNTI